MASLSQTGAESAKVPTSTKTAMKDSIYYSGLMQLLNHYLTSSSSPSPPLHVDNSDSLGPRDYGSTSNRAPPVQSSVEAGADDQRPSTSVGASAWDMYSSMQRLAPPSIGLFNDFTSTSKDLHDKSHLVPTEDYYKAMQDRHETSLGVKDLLAKHSVAPPGEWKRRGIYSYAEGAYSGLIGGTIYGDKAFLDLSENQLLALGNEHIRTPAIMGEAHPGVVWPSDLNPHYIGVERPWIPKGKGHDPARRPLDAICCTHFPAGDDCFSSIDEDAHAAHELSFNTFPPTEDAVNYGLATIWEVPFTSLRYPRGRRMLMSSYFGRVDQFGVLSSTELRQNEVALVTKEQFLSTSATSPSWVFNLCFPLGFCCPSHPRPVAHWSSKRVGCLSRFFTCSLPRFVTRKFADGTLGDVVGGYKASDMPVDARFGNNPYEPGMAKDVKDLSGFVPEYARYTTHGKKSIQDSGEVGLGPTPPPHTTGDGVCMCIACGWGPAPLRSTPVVIPTINTSRCPKDQDNVKGSDDANKDGATRGASARTWMSSDDAFVERMKNKGNVQNERASKRGGQSDCALVTQDTENVLLTPMLKERGGPHSSSSTNVPVLKDDELYDDDDVDDDVDEEQGNVFRTPGIRKAKRGGGKGTKTKNKNKNNERSLGGGSGASGIPYSARSYRMNDAKGGKYQDYNEFNNPHPNRNQSNDRRVGADTRGIVIDIEDVLPKEPSTSSHSSGDTSRAGLLGNNKKQSGYKPVSVGLTTRANNNNNNNNNDNSVSSFISQPATTNATPSTAATSPSSFSSVDVSASLSGAAARGLPCADISPYEEPWVVHPRTSAVCCTPRCACLWVSACVARFRCMRKCVEDSVLHPETILYHVIDSEGRLIQTSSNALLFMRMTFETAMYTPSFLLLPASALSDILDESNLDVDEFLLFQSCVRWARHRLHSSGRDHTSPLLIREEMNSFIGKIRFAAMRHAEIERVTRTGLLTREEALAIWMLKLTQDQPSILFEGFVPPAGGVAAYVDRVNTATAAAAAAASPSSSASSLFDDFVKGMNSDIDRDDEKKALASPTSSSSLSSLNALISTSSLAPPPLPPSSGAIPLPALPPSVQRNVIPPLLTPLHPFNNNGVVTVGGTPAVSPEITLGSFYASYHAYAPKSWRDKLVESKTVDPTYRKYDPKLTNAERATEYTSSMLRNNTFTLQNKRPGSNQEWTPSPIPWYTSSSSSSSSAALSSSPVLSFDSPPSSVAVTDASRSLSPLVATTAESASTSTSTLAAASTASAATVSAGTGGSNRAQGTFSSTCSNHAALQTTVLYKDSVLANPRQKGVEEVERAVAEKRLSSAVPQISESQGLRGNVNRLEHRMATRRRNALLDTTLLLSSGWAKRRDWTVAFDGWFSLCNSMCFVIPTFLLALLPFILIGLTQHGHSLYHPAVYITFALIALLLFIGTCGGCCLSAIQGAFPVTDHKNDVNDLRSCCVANYSYVHLMGHLLEQSQHGDGVYRLMALFSHLMLVATNALIAALALSQLSDVSLENMFYIFYGHFFTLLFQAKFFDTHNYAIDTVMPLIAVTEASLVLVLAQLRLFHGKDYSMIIIFSPLLVNAIPFVIIFIALYRNVKKEACIFTTVVSPFVLTFVFLGFYFDGFRNPNAAFSPSIAVACIPAYPILVIPLVGVAVLTFVIIKEFRTSIPLNPPTTQPGCDKILKDKRDDHTA